MAVDEKSRLRQYAEILLGSGGIAALLAAIGVIYVQLSDPNRNKPWNEAARCQTIAQIILAVDPNSELLAEDRVIVDREISTAWLLCMKKGEQK